MSKEVTIKQKETTEKVNRLLDFGVSQKAIYDKLGIVMITFYARLARSNWKLSEIETIKNMRIE